MRSFFQHQKLYRNSVVSSDGQMTEYREKSEQLTEKITFIKTLEFCQILALRKIRKKR